MCTLLHGGSSDSSSSSGGGSSSGSGGGRLGIPCYGTRFRGLLLRVNNTI